MARNKAAPESKGIVDREKYQYDKVKLRGKDGKLRQSVGNGDAVATAMLGMSHADVKRAAKENGLKIKESGNPGTYRMTVGQSLRARVRRGEPVTVAGVVIKKLDQRVKMPDIVEKPKPAGRARKSA